MNARRWPFAALAYLAVALAMVGVLLPGLPTVPFLLLAAWAAARGSRRLHRWLYDHPRFGQALIDWERSRAISRRSKVATVLLLGASWGLLAWRDAATGLLVALALLFTAVTTFVLTRPDPP